MSEFSQQLEKMLALVENEIQNSFPQKSPANLYDPINYLFESKGKRLRPLLTMISCGMVGGDTLEAFKPAVAFELLHNFTLIHDDIMDKSPTRRGRVTIHTKWNEAIGILSGDLLLALAYKKIIESVDTELNQSVLKTFTEGYIEVCEGQGFDIDFESRKDITEAEYFNMIDKKTAKLIEKAMVAGGQIGKADEEQILKLAEIGKNLGLAFQLQDDLLDLTAKSDKFGKEIGKDIKEGKKTFIMIKAKEIFSNSEDCELIGRFYENNGLAGEDIPKMINALHKNGIFDLVNNKINDYFRLINSMLVSFPESENKVLMKEIINFTLNREY
jgi:geranylgeranyl diphosphate synthase type II